MNLDLLALSIHVALGGQPWDGWTGVHGIPGTPNGVWRSKFGRLGSFCVKTSALRPDPDTDLPDPYPPAWRQLPRLTDLPMVMRAVNAFPGVEWAPPLELKPFTLDPPAVLLADHTADPEAWAGVDFATKGPAHV